MQLTYRGAHYNYTPGGAEADREANVFRALRPTYQLHYRGTVYAVDPNVEPRRSVAQPVGPLHYRGVAYSLNGETFPTSRKAVSVVPSRPAFNRKAASPAEFAAVHRDNLYKNLQHRLQVARDKQDQTLINLLERELQQIV
ncbi:DUF4278 domain-containing protein [Phormidium sp. FACHB-592]|uniref:DUF4278 domain-containing protein n=1 Tax=Stenomitos frigidus AS-A4 TaxID=2933935 RepID=A0ABV0KQU9_9CYAN|nr:DUF4278 domain-containing protein [Phormidium sp. FACHB-592]MBD2074379.1 DUF4278 domain-containing protein [Phormidium sp. FACHB-592]